MKQIIFTTAIMISSLACFAQQSGQLTYSEVKQLDGLIEKKNVSQQTLREMGAAHIQNAAFDEALPFYERLFQNGTDLISMDHFNYAQCLRVDGKYAEAEEQLKKYASQEGKIYEPRDSETYLAAIKEQSNRYALTTLSTNSDQSEIPVGSHESTLYFMTNRKSGVRDLSTDSKTYNIWEGSFGDNGLISSVSKTENLNKRLHEGGLAISNDGKWGYFTQSDKKTGQLIIIKALNVAGKWMPQETAHFSSEEYSVMHPALSADNKRLYFVSNMPGGNGLTDIYYAEILEGGKLGQPMNLGGKVNSIGNEAFPFLDKDGNLYFSSNGKNSLGGLDVFVSLKDKTTKKFQEAINVGEPVNSKYDDFGYIVSNGKQGYFASNRSGGSGSDDIYGFTEKIPLRISGALKFEQLDVISSNSYTADKKIDQGSYYLIPKDAEEITDPQRGLDKVYLNSDGSFTSETPLDLDKYFAISEGDLDEAENGLAYQEIELKNADQFSTEGYIQDGFYYLVPKNQKNISDANVLSTPTEVRPDGSYLSKDTPDNGTYYLVPKEAEEIAMTDVVGNLVEMQQDGKFSFDKELPAGKYALLPKDPTTVVGRLKDVEDIEVLDNNHYIVDTPVEKGNYYMIPKEVEEMNDVNGRVPATLSDDGSYNSDSELPTGNFYLVPKSSHNTDELSKDQFMIRNDGSYEGGNSIAQGEYILVPLESESVGEANIIGKTVALNGSGKIQEGIDNVDPGSYYALDADKLAQNAKLKKNMVELDGEGNYTSTSEIEKGAYILIPSDRSLSNKINTNDLSAELMDDGTYRGADNLPKGTYYILPKYTELIEDAKLGLNSIKVEEGGSYKSKKQLVTGDYYLVPREDILNTDVANIEDVQGVQNIYFDLNSSVLTSRSFVELEKLVDLLKESPSTKVQMSGHADQQGSEEYNMWLSEQRAKMAVKYLMKEGITKDRVFWKAVGELSPTSDCPNGDCGDEQFALDRRVEFILFEE